MASRKNMGFKMSNLLLVAGNGRNVGKTWFTCRVIEHLATFTKVSAIKISSHFHPYTEDAVLIKTEDFIIIEEKRITQKDSSLMLQAGAQKVYFIMAAQAHLAEAFSQLQPHLPHHAIVCESGGLHQVLNPGLFFFVNREGKEIVKTHHLAYTPIQVINNGVAIDFNIKKIDYKNGELVLKA